MVRRVVILAIALLAMVPAVAGAAVTKKVKQSPGDVRAYWTKERMQDAKPVRLDRSGKPQPTPTASWTSFEAPLNASGAEYADRRHGKVFFSDGPSNYVCSGTALRGANGRSVVWTAGHCVVEGGGGIADEYTNWAFVPAYRDGARPHGTFPATNLSYAADWDRSLQYGHDFAAATVGPNTAGQALESAIAATGFELAVNYAKPNATSTLGTMESHGYPAAGAFDGQSQNVCRSSVIRRDSARPPTMAINCDSTGGSSGGSWLNSAGRVASVNSYGYGNLPNVMFGPAQDSEATAVYNAAVTG